jgi:2,4'-dihydroxyacetophenone dioxygenase
MQSGEVKKVVDAAQRAAEFKALGIPAGRTPGAVLVNTNEMKWTPFPEGNGQFILLNLDPTTGGWTGLVKFPAGVVVPMHLHSGGIDLYNISGKWSYAEGEMSAGSYFYEPSGVIHEPAIELETTLFAVVRGASIFFDEDGKPVSWQDAHMLYTLCKNNGAVDHLKHLDGLMEDRPLPEGHNATVVISEQ